jgi:hypothetical protein
MAAADSVGRTIWKFIRNTILVIIGILVLWGVVALIFHTLNEWKEEKVKVTLTHKGLCTDPAYPLQMMISNDSGETVIETRFSIMARNPGFSTNLVNGGYQKWDAIIKPSQARGTCWAYPRLSDEGYSDPPKPSEFKKEDLEWSVERDGVTFGN